MKITQYTQENVGVGLNPVRAGAAAFGGNTAGLEAQARGMASAAQDLGQTANVLQEIQTRKEASDYAAIMAEKQLELAQLEETLKQSEFEEGADLSKVYAERYDEVMKSIEANIPRTQRDRFQADKAVLRGRFSQGGIQEQSNRAALKIKTNWEKTLTASANSIALNPSNYGAAYELMRQQVEAMPGGAEVKAAAMMTGEQSLKGALAEAQISRNPSEFIRKAKAGEFSELPNLDKYLRSANHEIERKQATYRAAVREEAVTQLEIASKGIPLDDAVLQQTEAKAKAAGLDNVASKIAEVRSTITFRNEELQKPLTERRKEYDALMKDTANASPERLNKLNVLSDLIEADAKALQSGEALDLYISRKNGKPLPDIDLNNPDPAVLAMYKGEAESASAYYGRTVPPVNKAQIDSINQQLTAASTDQQVQIVSKMAEVFTPQEIAALTPALEKQHVPMAAAAVMLKEGFTESARHIVDGAKRPDVVKKSELEQAVYSKLAMAVRDPETYGDLQQAVVNSYKSIAFNNGNMSDALDNDILERAITSTLGGEVHAFGNNTILPYKRPKEAGVSTTEQVETLLRSLSLPVMEKSGIKPPMATNGDKLDITKKFSGIKFISSGDGRVNILDKDSGFYFTDENEQIYELDLKEVEEKVKSSRLQFMDAVRAAPEAPAEEFNQ